MGAQITSTVFPPMRSELTKLSKSTYPQSRILSPFDFTYKSVIDKQLNEVKNDENREKCVQVHIKTETPLNILIREKMSYKHWLRFIIRCNLNLISMSWLEQERVAHPPQQSCDHQANPDLSISQLRKTSY